MKTLLIKNQKYMSDINHFGSRKNEINLSAEMPLCCAYLRAKGHNVDLLNYNESSEVDYSLYDLVVVWVSSQGFEECIEDVKEAKIKHHKKVAMILNDTYGDMTKVRMDKYPFIDFVIKRYHREL